MTAQSHDTDLAALIASFAKVCTNIETLREVRPKLWQRDVKKLLLEKQQILNFICESIKSCSLEEKEKLREEFYSKWSIILP